MTAGLERAAPACAAAREESFGWVFEKDAW